MNKIFRKIFKDMPEEAILAASSRMLDTSQFEYIKFICVSSEEDAYIHFVKTKEVNVFLLTNIYLSIDGNNEGVEKWSSKILSVNSIQKMCKRYCFYFNRKKSRVVHYEYFENQFPQMENILKISNF